MSEVESQQNPRMPSLLWLLSLKQGPPRVADVPSSLNQVFTKMASFGQKGEPYFSCQPPPMIPSPVFPVAGTDVLRRSGCAVFCCATPRPVNWWPNQLTPPVMAVYRVRPMVISPSTWRRPRPGRAAPRSICNNAKNLRPNTRAVDSLSFSAYPDTTVFLNADPNTAAFFMQIWIQL